MKTILFLAAFTFSQIITYAPTIAGGFGKSPSLYSNNGAIDFDIVIGAGGIASSGTVRLPNAPNSWKCQCTDPKRIPQDTCRQTVGYPRFSEIRNFSSDSTETAWVPGSRIHLSCLAW